MRTYILSIGYDTEMIEACNLRHAGRIAMDRYMSTGYLVASCYYEPGVPNRKTFVAKRNGLMLKGHISPLGA